MCPSASRVCSEPGGQKPVLSLSLDLIASDFREINEISEKNPKCDLIMIFVFAWNIYFLFLLKNLKFFNIFYIL